MNDIDNVLLQARDSLAGAHMDIPVEAIFTRSRSQRHRRRVAGLSAAGVAAGTGLALGLAGAFGPASPRSASASSTTTASSCRTSSTTTLTPAQPTHPATDPALLRSRGDVSAYTVPAAAWYAIAAPGPGGH
jgi:hypothetical protein